MSLRLDFTNMIATAPGAAGIAERDWAGAGETFRRAFEGV